MDSWGADRNGEFVIRFSGEKGKWYALQRTSALGESAFWHIVACIRAESDGEMELRSCPPERWGSGFYRVVKAATYLVVDMSGGQDVEKWPVSELECEPADGWTDEYKTTKLVLRRIEAGMFKMGSPSSESGRNSNENQHNVTLTKPYYMGIFEVTKKQYQIVTGGYQAYGSQEMRPVVEVSWDDIRDDSGWPDSMEVSASSFMGRLRAKTGRTFDLPTEAQWEYACRAGTTMAYSYGDSADENFMWYASNSSQQPHDVGTKQPNAWGLYDMHGNVEEWCLDYLDKWAGYETVDVIDPVGFPSGSVRALRGGSCYYKAPRCRSAYRGYSSPSNRSTGLGFRLCCPAEMP